MRSATAIALASASFWMIRRMAGRSSSQPALKRLRTPSSIEAIWSSRTMVPEAVLTTMGS